MNSSGLNKKLIISAVLFFSLVMSASWLINRAHWSDTLTPLIEGIFCLLIIVGLLSNRHLQSYILKCPLSCKIIFLSLFFCIASAHYIGKVRTTYPFIPWRMFTLAEPAHTAVFYEVIGEHSSGKEETLNLAHLFPTLYHGQLSIGVGNLMREIESQEREENQLKEIPSRPTGAKEGAYGRKWPPADSSLKHFSNSLRELFKDKKAELTLAEKKDQINDILAAIASMYNHKYPAKPLEAIFISRGAVDLNQSPIADTVKEKVWRLKLKDNGKAQ